MRPYQIAERKNLDTKMKLRAGSGRIKSEGGEVETDLWGRQFELKARARSERD